MNVREINKTLERKKIFNLLCCLLVDEVRKSEQQTETEKTGCGIWVMSSQTCETQPTSNCEM